MDPLKKALADVKLCFKANTVKHGKAIKRWLTKMLKRERLDQVMNMVTEQNYISVADLAKSLQVSEMTIRRDFYQFYSLYDIDELVTNSQVSADVLKYYQQYYFGADKY